MRRLMTSLHPVSGIAVLSGVYIIYWQIRTRTIRKTTTRRTTIRKMTTRRTAKIKKKRVARSVTSSLLRPWTPRDSGAHFFGGWSLR